MEILQDFSVGTSQDAQLSQIERIWKSGRSLTFDSNSIKKNQILRFRENFANRSFPFLFWTVSQEEQVLGWLSVLPAFRHPMKADTDGEISIYIDPMFTNMGIGTTLLSHALSELKYSKLDHVWAFVHKANIPSSRLFDKSQMSMCGETSSRYIYVREYP